MSEPTRSCSSPSSPGSGWISCDSGHHPYPCRDRTLGRTAAATARRPRRSHGSARGVIELRRLLYGLYAITRLHNAQEDENAFSLIPG